ncbi:hypothetical protein [Paenibacillus sp. FSL H8-0283]|uniref:hypothetical protein n=1 Tax=Paenibacillus sp. FSL H8-0283 TaxID=2921383 RepID=UPI00324735A0
MELFFCGIQPDFEKFIVAVTFEFLNKFEAMPNNHFVDLVFAYYAIISNLKDIESLPRDLAILDENDESFHNLLNNDEKD